MVVRFDTLDRVDPPKMFICSPGCTYNNGLLSNSSGILYNTSDEELVLRFNEQSELNFRVYTLPPQEDPDERAAFRAMYKSLQNRRLLFLEDIGFFVISEVTNGYDDGGRYIDVRAFSCETEIENKALPYIADGTYDFTALLNTVIGAVPLWTVGTIDLAVASRYRTFEDVSEDLNCLGFMQEEMQDAYECIFIYDTINRTVSVYDQNNYVVDTSIHLTTDDLIDELKVTENSDDLYTAITVQGDEELNISPVNPLGTNTIYNFDYYISWMSSGLAAKVTAWQTLVQSKESDYYNLNYDYYNALQEKSDVEADIDAINTQLTMYRRCRENIVAENGTSQVAGYNEVIVNSGGIPITGYDGVEEALATIDALVADVEDELADREDDLDTVNATLASLSTQIDTIHEQVAITEYFTSAELAELDNYIFEGQYTDEYITVTDIMEYDEIFSQMKILYDRAKTQLERISQPTQEFNVSSENFIFVKEFEPWSSQLETGCLINVELEPGDVAMLFLTEITVNYDDCSLSLTFGNRFTKFSPKSLFDDVLGDVRKSANTLDYIKEILYPIQNGEFNQMREALQNSRNLTKAAAMSSDNEEVLIDDTGYTGRRFLGNGEYDPKQIKINGRNIVFSDDAWETAKIAIGELILSNSETVYGVNAEALFGDFIVGNNLRILNSDGEDIFVATESGIMSKIMDDVPGVVGDEVGRAIDGLNLSSQISTQISQAAGDIRFDFNQAIGNVNGTIDTFQQYIRFENGNIILGKSDSPVQLKIENDKIRIYSGDTDITSWSTAQILSPKVLKIPDGGVLYLGSFEFIPRDNGSLDFTWVG